MRPLRSPNAAVIRLIVCTTCFSAMISAIACTSEDDAGQRSDTGTDAGPDGDSSIDAASGGQSGAAGASGSAAAGAGGVAGSGGASGTAGDSGSGGVAGSGGASGAAGDSGSGGVAGSGGASGTGSGGLAGAGGDPGTGGTAGSAGTGGSSGTAGSGGMAGSGGAGTGGAGTGGSSNGGSSGQAGSPGTGGAGGAAGNALVYDGAFINYSPSAADLSVIFGHKHAFLHQSTGQYMLDAIPAVAGFASPDTSKIRSIQWAPQDIGNGINELWFSTSDVLQKTNDFATFVNEGTNGTYYETFLFKYCFLDQWQTANPSQTPQEVLAHYKQTVSALHAQFPGKRFVHMTWPIYEEVGWTEQENVTHGKYNQLLRAEYGGKEPIFDLADIEATRADGTSCTFVEAGTSTSWPVFCPGEAEPDHGHPGPGASTRLARVFLYMLHDLYK